MGLQNAPLDAAVIFSDITTNNASITKHGFLPKLPNDVTKFLTGLGTFVTPASGGLATSASQYVIVGGEASATANWTALSAAYTVATTATPNGAALSASNRYTIFLLPGVYDLGASTFTLNTEGVDIVGLSPNTGDVKYSGSTIVSFGDTLLTSTGTVVNINNTNIHDITIANVAIQTTTGTAALNTTQSGFLSGLKVLNVLIDGTGSSTMAWNKSYNGTWIDVRCFQTRAFGRSTGTALTVAGLFIRCKGRNMMAGEGGVVTISATVIDCEAGTGSFGADGDVISGTFLRCRYISAYGGLGSGMFGGSTGTISSTAYIEDCLGDVAAGAFGGGAMAGTLKNCSGSNVVGWSSVTGTVQNCNLAGIIQNRNLNLNARHLIGNSAVPTIAAGAGAGTGPTVSIVGNDAAGRVTITSGTTPSLAAVIVTTTFNVAYEVAPYVVLWPAEANAAALGFLPFVATTTTTFTINSATALGLIGATTYKYNYIVVQ